LPILHGLASGSTEKMQDEFKKMVTDTGAGGCVTNTAWNKEWVTSEKQLADLDTAVHMVKEQGYKAWMYDEYWYPSTWANGLVAKDHPEYILKVISPLSLKGNGAQNVTLALPIEGFEGGFEFIYAAFYNIINGEIDYLFPNAVSFEKDKVSTVSPEGDWLLLAFYIRRHNIGIIEGEDPNSLPGGYRQCMDMLNKDAVDKFLDSALGTVADFITDFDKCFDAIFTDEPSFISMYMIDKNKTQSFNGVPYTPALFETFKQMHHYDLLPHLAYLFYDESDKAKIVRVQFYRTLSKLVVESYAKNYQAWCHAHNTKFSGHMLLEEGLKFHVGLYADLMEVYCNMDIPGFDFLIAKWELFWQKGYASDHYCYLPGKLASSAARINGHNHTMEEVCPVAYREMLDNHPFVCSMALSTHTAFTGATYTNAYCYGTIKDLAQANLWNEYVGRLQYITRNSMPDFRIAVFYPIADTQADFFSEDLEMRKLSPLADDANTSFVDFIYGLYRAQADCNVVTEKALLDAKIEKGCFIVGGFEYKSIVMPQTEVLPLAVLKRLEQLKNAGVAVYFLGSLPRLGVSENEHDDVIEAVKALNIAPIKGDMSQLFSELKDLAALSLNISGLNSENILASRYIHEGKTMYFLINSCEEDITFNIYDTAAKNAVLYNPEDGTDIAIKMPCTISINANRGIFLRYE